MATDAAVSDWARDASPEEDATRLQLRDLVTGAWFPHVVELYVRYRARRRRIEPGRHAEVRGAEALIERASVESALGGAATAAVTSGAAWLSAQGPVGAMAALPIGAVAVGAEMLFRALVDLRLACDLADRAGVPFDPEQPGDLARLAALVHGGERSDDGSLGRGVVDRLVTADDDDQARNAGLRRLVEGFAKNLVPVVNVVTSATASWYRTRQLGEAAWRYVRYRRVGEALQKAAEGDAALRQILIEAAWVMFTADGPLEPEQTALLVHALRGVGPDGHDELRSRFVPGPEAFLDRLMLLPSESRATVWRALQLLAAADGAVSAADRQLLDAVGKQLGEEVQHEQLAAMVEELSGPAPLSPRSPQGGSVRRERAPASNGKRRRKSRGRTGGARPTPQHPEGTAHP